MSSDNLDHFENHLSEAEKYVGEDFYIAADHYSAAKQIAENEEIEEYQRRRLELLREDALEQSLNGIEEIMEEADEGVYRRDVVRDLWEVLNEVENFADEDGMPERYHNLREQMANESYKNIFEKSVGIVNDEISIFDDPGIVDEDILLAERAVAAEENARVAEEMAEYIGEDHPADSVYFDHSEVLDSLDRIAIGLADNMNTAETRAAFENLAVLTEIYGVVNSLVDEGLKTKTQLNRMDFDIRSLEDKQRMLEDDVEKSLDIEDELHKLEHMIGKTRSNLEGIELPEEQEQKLWDRIEFVEQEADQYWQRETNGTS